MIKRQHSSPILRRETMTGFAIDAWWRWHVTGGFALRNFSVVATCAGFHGGDFFVIDLRRIPVFSAMTHYAFLTGTDVACRFSWYTHAVMTTDASPGDITMIEIRNRPIRGVLVAGIAVGADRGGHVRRGFADGAAGRKHTIVATIATRCYDKCVAECLRFGKSLRRYVMTRLTVNPTGRWKMHGGLAGREAAVMTHITRLRIRQFKVINEKRGPSFAAMAAVASIGAQHVSDRFARRTHAVMTTHTILNRGRSM